MEAAADVGVEVGVCLRVVAGVNTGEVEEAVLITVGSTVIAPDASAVTAGEAPMSGVVISAGNIPAILNGLPDPDSRRNPNTKSTAAMQTAAAANAVRLALLRMPLSILAGRIGGMGKAFMVIKGCPLPSRKKIGVFKSVSPCFMRDSPALGSYIRMPVPWL